MPPKPEYFHDLNIAVTLLQDRAESLRQELANQAKVIATLQDAIVELRRANALLEHKVNDQVKQIEEWDRRWWGFIVILIGALLSLAAGLVVSLVRR